MNILVTGGLGLIGHHVVSKLQKLGHQVSVLDTRTNYGIIDPEEIKYLIPILHRNSVYHPARLIHRFYDCRRHYTGDAIHSD